VDNGAVFAERLDCGGHIDDGRIIARSPECGGIAVLEDDIRRE
jgi:hypothetical protein